MLIAVKMETVSTVMMMVKIVSAVVKAEVLVCPVRCSVRVIQRMLLIVNGVVQRAMNVRTRVVLTRSGAYCHGCADKSSTLSSQFCSDLDVEGSSRGYRLKKWEAIPVDRRDLLLSRIDLGK